MNWETENVKDTGLLAKMNLGALVAGEIHFGTNISAVVDAHNAKLAGCMERFRKLTNDRERLMCFETWSDADGVTIRNESFRLRRESWDVLQELCRILEERGNILARMEKYLQSQFGAASQERKKTVADVKKTLSKDRRGLMKANPATAESHFGDTVEYSDTVQTVDERIAATRSEIDAAASAKRRIVADLSDIKARQGEVFQLLAC